jgi:predicted enzyme involved in methoxymalonyl-ACP biosynthesis
MRKLNREQKRRIINAKKQNLLPEIERLYVDSYNEGVRDAYQPTDKNAVVTILVRNRGDEQ